MKSMIFPLVITAGLSLNLFAAPDLVGTWITTYGRYSDTVTFKVDGTFESLTETVRGSESNQGNANKSTGTWKLVGNELERNLNGHNSKLKIRMTSPTSFEEPDELGENGVLIYKKKQNRRQIGDARKCQNHVSKDR